MLWRVVIDKLNRLIQAARQQHPAIVRQHVVDKSLPPLWQLSDVLRQNRQRVLRHCAAVRYKNGCRLWPMLGLHQQIERRQTGVGLLVGQNNRFAWPGGKANIHRTVQQPFGCGHVATPGPSNFVHPGYGFSPKRQRGDGLHTPDCVYLIHTANLGSH